MDTEKYGSVWVLYRKVRKLSGSVPKVCGKVSCKTTGMCAKLRAHPLPLCYSVFAQTDVRDMVGFGQEDDGFWIGSGSSIIRTSVI